MLDRVIPQSPTDEGRDRLEFTDSFELHRQLMALYATLESLPAVADNVVVIAGESSATNHSEIPVGNIHLPHNWQVPTVGDLTSISPVAEDLWKLARVHADNSYHTLTQISPDVWTPLGGSNSPERFEKVLSGTLTTILQAEHGLDSPRFVVVRNPAGEVVLTDVTITGTTVTVSSLLDMTGFTATLE